MKNKELRKELELELLKGLEETLKKKNPAAGKKLNEVTHHASKIIAKKFYKAVKSLADKKVSASIKKTKVSPQKASTKPVAKATAKAVKKNEPKPGSKK